MNKRTETGEAPPVFIFGFDRSGTTLFSMMIGAHPDIAVPFSTTGLWYRYGQKLEEYNGLTSECDVKAMVRDLLSEERIRLWDVEFNLEEMTRGMPLGNYPMVINRFHSEYARLKSKPRWGNIDIDTINNMDLANSWFPGGQFIHIVRDGRDVAISNMAQCFSPAVSIGHCAKLWDRRVYTNIKMGRILGGAKYLIIRYEDLILETEKTLQQVCKFLKVDYSAQMLNYARQAKEKVPENRRFLWPLLTKPPVKENAYKWRILMNKSQRIVFEREAGALLKSLGYEAYERIPRSVCAYGLELWYFLNIPHHIKRFAWYVRKTLQIRKKK
jgi:hypothetical protein